MVLLVPLRMFRLRAFAAITIVTLASLAGFETYATDTDAVISVSARPLSNGSIDPKLFGNFVELLEDVVPGMWAEMLNDRAFDGVIPGADWSYYDGSPTICDRHWDTNATWHYDSTNVFNGSRCA
jgi:hypothetical protein